MTSVVKIMYDAELYRYKHWPLALYEERETANRGSVNIYNVSVFSSRRKLVAIYTDASYIFTARIFFYCRASRFLTRQFAEAALREIDGLNIYCSRREGSSELGHAAFAFNVCVCLSCHSGAIDPMVIVSSMIDKENYAWAHALLQLIIEVNDSLQG